jgi:Uma2 family endonuclease
MATTTTSMTVAEFLALPDDGIHRELIRGELREYPMTTRGGPHGWVTSNLARLLGNWLQGQPAPRGRLYTGEARVYLRHFPSSMVGIDLAYITPEHAARTAPAAPYIDGPPVLAVEILSPSDTMEGIAEKVADYLDAGVALVWEVNAYYKTVTVHRPEAPPLFFNEQQDLTAEPHLPGFRVPVAEIFAT